MPAITRTSWCWKIWLAKLELLIQSHSYWKGKTATCHGVCFVMSSSADCIVLRFQNDSTCIKHYLLVCFIALSSQLTILHERLSEHPCGFPALNLSELITTWLTSLQHDWHAKLQPECKSLWKWSLADVMQPALSPASFITSFPPDHQVVCVDCWKAQWSKSDSAFKWLP